MGDAAAALVDGVADLPLPRGGNTGGAVAGGDVAHQARLAVVVGLALVGDARVPEVAVARTALIVGISGLTVVTG